MKKKIVTGIIIYAAGFIVLFLLRVFYGALVSAEANPYPGYANVGLINDAVVQQQSGEQSFFKNNYASTKRSIKKEAVKEKIETVTVDQKYEKIAQLTQVTPDFDKTDSEIRAIIKKNQAIIQFERNSGLKGARALELVIGVPPELFDVMVSEAKNLAVLKAFDVNIFDKTSEYREIQSKVASLEKTRDSLSALRARAGKIEELMNLEYKILDVEKEIQSLGVKLGDYSKENELCTIKFYLTENKRTQAGTNMARLLLKSLEWTFGTYAAFTVIAFFALFGLWFLLIIIEKLKLIEKLVKKNKPKK
jgi:hypothetical protein